MISKRLHIIFGLAAIFISGAAIAGGTVKIDRESFDADGSFALTLSDNWLFHQGNDPSWAEPGINTEDWERLNPTELKIDMRNGRSEVEG